MPLSNRRQFLVASGVAGAALAAQGADAGPREPDKTAPRFRLGIVTYNIAAGWDVPTLLRICRAVGIAAVELRTTHKHGIEPTLNNAQRKEVRQRFQDAGVEIWGCGTTCEFQSPEKAVVQRNIETCRQFCQLVSDLGGKGVKVRPNSLPRGVPPERTLEQIGRSLIPCGEAAAAAGVEIWVEVHGPGTQDPVNMRTIMEHCKHRAVGVTWNSNPTDVVKGSIAASFKMLQPWIKSVHINELHSGYPYRDLFRLLREMNYDRYTLAEIQGTADAASGERLLRYYKMLWSELCR